MAANQYVKEWSTQRKIKAAIEKVLDEGWTISEAARYYEINRSNLSRRVKKARQEREEAERKAAEELERQRIPIVQQARNVGTFPEFWENYFSGTICPDCQVRHEMPGFHHEMIDAIEAGHRRIVINLPPYHAKSTVVTIWHTVYDIARNPNLRTIVVSKSSQFAKTFIRAIKGYLSNPDLYIDAPRNLIDDWGPFMPEESRQGGWSEFEIYVANRTSGEKDPTVLAMGYGGQIYGRRADKIKFDDYATLENQRNPDRVASMLEWTDKEALSRIGKRGQAVWVGTRVAAGDVYSVLQRRPGYHVIRYPLIIGDEEVLWPEHFPYEQALIHRSEMSPTDFQLIYQNVDVPGLNASFTEEMMDAAKDNSRSLGHWQDGWRLIAGLDPAGANKGSGFTAMVLLGVDLNTGHRFLVDLVAERQMKAPRLKELMLEWSYKYPIYEWRVESNGVQSQLVQYNYELIQALAKKGVAVRPHFTYGNKWDPEFGVESLAPLFHAGLVSLPWAGSYTAQRVQNLIEQFISFPMGQVQDLVMAFWFAELGVRSLLERAHLPLFNDRMRRRWPNRIKKRARIVDFENREVRPVSIQDQRLGHLTRGLAGYRRATVGNPMPHSEVREFDPEPGPELANIDPSIWSS
ncbi:MAG TPA: helix-turn-helix domain-containing protein [Acidimicrobiia bacterium]